MQTFPEAPDPCIRGSESLYSPVSDVFQVEISSPCLNTHITGYCLFVCWFDIVQFVNMRKIYFIQDFLRSITLLRNIKTL